MLLSELFEARANPELNPKKSINDVLINIAIRTKDRVAGTTNRFVSFTTVDKLGINPSSEHDTPLGIYAYPIDYVIELTGRDEKMTKLPLAGEAPYANTFKVTGNIINVAKMTGDDARTYYIKIKDYVLGVTGDEQDVATVDQYIRNAKTQAKVNNYSGGQFWFVTMMVADMLAERLNKAAPVMWNVLFRQIGIDGAVDMINDTDGAEIIHENEPCQAVFFSLGVIIDVERHINKYSHKWIKKRVDIGRIKREQMMSDVEKLRAGQTADEIFDILDKDIGLHKIRLVDPKIREQIIAQHPRAIYYIPRPTDNEQRIALSIDFTKVLERMSNINQSVVAKVFLEDPSDDRLRAIMTAIDHIGPELQKAIVTVHPNLLLDFDRTYRSVVQTAIANWKSPTLPNWMIKLAKQFNVEV
jgi:hypothetical protein